MARQKRPNRCPHTREMFPPEDDSVITFTKEIRMKIAPETIQISPLDALRDLVRRVDAGEIELQDLCLDTSSAALGKLEFVFRGTAVARNVPVPPATYKTTW